MNFQSLFEGYQNTPNLWDGILLGLQQYVIPKTQNSFQPKEPYKKLRLGKWVEKFMVHQIQEQEHYKLITDGLQVRKYKQTLGELDILYLKKKQPVHLECVYKFYLYDHTRSYRSKLEYWIGPNRTDTLMLKLEKLRYKQLPLLQHAATQSYLEELGFHHKDFEQRVRFKAQLFLPLSQLNHSVEPLNKKCIYGFHCGLKELQQFHEFHLYIPSKLEWLTQPNQEVDWQTFSEGYKMIEDQCKSHRSPMIWLKDPENNFQKAFVTWW